MSRTAAREGILEALDAALGPLAAEYRRNPKGDPDHYPALHLYDNGQAPVVGDEVNSTRRAIQVTLYGFVSLTDGADASASLNLLHAEAVEGVFAQESLHGIESIEEGYMRFERAEQNSRSLLMFAQDFSLIFVTPRGAPFAS